LWGAEEKCRDAGRNCQKFIRVQKETGPLIAHSTKS